MPPSLSKRCIAESFGTFWLVFAGIGSAIIAAGIPVVGIGYIGVAFAVGLTVMTMAYAIGHISGCHLNPAVTLGLLLGKRFPAKEVLPYWLAQVVGAIIAGRAIYFIASRSPTFVMGHFGCNGYGDYSPTHYSFAACLVAEVLLTFFFLLIIMGSTDQRAAKGFAPLAIGLGLTLIHLIGIPITNLSVNPARSTGTALVLGGWAISQLWLFWLAPLVGGALGGVFYKAVLAEHEPPPVTEKPVAYSA